MYIYIYVYRSFMNGVSTDVAVMENETLRYFNGSYADFLRNEAENESFQLNRLDAQTRKVCLAIVLVDFLFVINRISACEIYWPLSGRSFEKSSRKRQNERR